MKLYQYSFISLMLFSLLFSSAFAVVSHPASQIEPGAFQTGNYYFPNGNVGIGTTNPSSYSTNANNLVIYETGGIAGLTIATDDDQGGRIYFANGTTGADNYRGYIGYDHADDSMFFATAGLNSAITIDSSARVGIGTDSPNTILELASSAPFLRLTDDDSATTVAINGIYGYDNAAHNTWSVGDFEGTDGDLRFRSNYGDFYFDTSLGNGKVGIGTNSPADKLHVLGGSGLGVSVSGTSPAFVLRDAANTIYGQVMLYDSDKTLRISTGAGATSLGIIQDTDGDVGIGVTNPTSKFEVSGAAFGTGVSAPTAKFSSNEGYTTSIMGGAIGRYDSATDNGALYMNYYGYQNGATYYRDFAVMNGKGAGTEILYVDGSAAGVGIGTTTPGAYKLYVNGNQYINGNLVLSGTVDGTDISAYSPYFISSAGSSGQVWKSDGSGAGVWGTDDDDPEPADVAWTDLTDDASMELTSGFYMDSYELRVCSGACGSQNYATAAGDLYVEDALEVDGYMYGSRLYDWNNAAYYLDPASSSNVNTMYATAYYYSSDERLKENIQTLDNSLENIKKLRGVSFNWKDTGEATDGLIAQELEKVYPELVSTKDDGYKSINYAGLIGPLIESVKELEQQNQELRKDIEELKQKCEE